MKFVEISVSRPVATTLLTAAVALAGIFAFPKLAVSPLPQVDFPTIMVQAQMPGASPEVMATSVTAPLERHLSRIADVTEITSQSSQSNSRIILQFGLDRDINGAVRDVEAAMNAAHADLPASLKSNPIYRKYNPADAPILTLALSSDTRTPGQIYDVAATILQQRLSQVEGVGNVDVGGSSLPAVRVELNPTALAHYCIGFEDVRAALASANANSPNGAIEQGDQRLQLDTNDQATHAADYRSLIVAYRKGRPTLLSDIAEVVDSVEDVRNAGFINGKPAVLLIVYRQPGANIIETANRIKKSIPFLQASIPGDTRITVTSDRTATIRTSLHDTELTLVAAVGLVILVVFVFLRDIGAILIPCITVPCSIIGTFAGMYLLGFSLNNLSLMALTIATGFVVDDVVVVLENIARQMEAGMSAARAAIEGTREVFFTVVSITASLIGVFLPILLMGGLVGRFFREFSLTLSIAISISLVLALTTTPMLCSRFLRVKPPKPPTGIVSPLERIMSGMSTLYRHTLRWALSHSLLVLVTGLLIVGLNFYLIAIVPKGFFPEEDTGFLVGGIWPDASISFQSLKQKLEQLQSIVQSDPAVESVVGYTPGGSAYVFLSLKPLKERHAGINQIMARLRPKLDQVPGGQLFLAPVQDFHVGGRVSLALYQFTLQGDTTREIYEWIPKLTEALKQRPELVDVVSDQRQNALETDITIDRSTVARLGLDPRAIDNTLYDAFGQRQVSTIYNPMNQYHVVMEVAPKYRQYPDSLKDIYVSLSGQSPSGTQQTNAVIGTFSSSTNPNPNNAALIASDSARNQATNSLASAGKSSVSSGAAVTTSPEKMIPLATFAQYRPGHAPLAVNHQGAFVASTISFNLPPGKTLSDATAAIRETMNKLHVPASLHGTFAGVANTFQSSLSDEPILILAAIGSVYIILGVLYESLIHPITILSTLPPASVGALIGLQLFHLQFDIIAMIGVILLIGIVKKNAIMMVDFALQAERKHGLSSAEAIFQACLVRFRPIMMTTFAAVLGALPLAFAFGEGSELRRPLGISIVGGLIVSQLLTLYSTPVVYLYLDRLSLWFRRGRKNGPRTTLA
jgi:multidrug efflux pump